MNSLQSEYDKRGHKPSRAFACALAGGAMILFLCCVATMLVLYYGLQP